MNSVSLLVVLSACLPALLCHGSLEAGPADTSELPELFDFGLYRQQFDKRYTTPLEISTRQVYFLANALQVYAAGVGYRSRQQGHYLALNHMSDWSPKEWLSVQDQTLGGAVVSPAGPTDSINDSAQAAGARQQQETDPTPMAMELISEIKRQLAKLSRDEERLAGPKRRRREKRAAPPATAQGETRNVGRHLPMDRLTQGRPTGEPIELLAKIEHRPKRNNMRYDSLAMSLISRGLDDQQESIQKWGIPAGKPDETAAAATLVLGQKSLSSNEATLLSRSLSAVLGSGQDGGRGGSGASSNGQPQPDEMFVDLRQSGCMFQPRKQGQCGASYAFAGISMAEWYYCRRHQKLLAFSEQYMLDCGMAQIQGIRGCQGASSTDVVPKFIHNFGLELAGSWPYLERDSRCIYSPKTDLNTVGFMRMRMDHIVGISVQYWPQLLKNGPLLVAVGMPADFRQYAGGVDSGESCSERPNHTMVVVGHGREDGQEFWLLRNSFGAQWGQGGYYKLAKTAPKNCMPEQKGFAFGTRNGRDYSPLKTAVNQANARARTTLANERKRGRSPVRRMS